MRRTTHTRRLEGRLSEVGPGLHEVSFRVDRRAYVQASLTFIDDHRFRGEGTVRFPDGRAVAIAFSTIHREDHS